MRNFKNIVKLVDSFITLADKTHDRFKGKNGQEALDILKNNIGALRSPETLANMKKVLQSKPPQEIGKLLIKSHKSLSLEDALKLAEILTDGNADKKLPEYLDKKISDLGRQPPNAPKKPGRGK